jgi:hypothetical protein
VTAGTASARVGLSVGRRLDHPDAASQDLGLQLAGQARLDDEHSRVRLRIGDVPQ